MAFALSGCGGVVLDHDAGTGGATSSGGGGATSSGATTATSGGKTGKPSAGGRTATGGVVGTAGVIGSGGSVSCAPLTKCPDGCADLQSSSTHCGSCFITCPSGASCVNGSCQTPSIPPASCKPPTVYCSNFGECLDTSSNPFACGSCNTPCNGTRCTNGRCDTTSCASSTGTYCPASKACVELKSDFSNCGACGNVCGPAESCSGGKCVPPTCGGGTYCKNSGCTDTDTDANNCGGCDKPCQRGAHFVDSAYACNHGTCGCSLVANKCGSSCASEFWYCPPDGFTGAPADYCRQTARNPYEACACKGCLAEVQACFGSPSCINAMDCALPLACPSCTPVFQFCTDEKGNPDPIAAKLLSCMNSTCASP